MKTQHTPGPCGCRVKSVQFSPGNPNGQFEVVYCPTHELAPEMVKILKVLACIADNDGPLATAYRHECEKARALLARLEG